MVAQEQQQQSRLPSHPQAASRALPNGYMTLAQESFREAGDLVWTMAGWIVCHISTGKHSYGAHACRKIPGATIHPPVAMELQHAPLRGANLPPLLEQSTPLFYFMSEPFGEEAEFKIFQMHQLRPAIMAITHKDASYCGLYVACYDHKEGRYDSLKIIWAEYIHDPEDIENPNSRSKRVMRNPYAIYGLISLAAEDNVS